MLKIKSAYSVPPGGYRFLVESTGLLIKAADMPSLLDAIKKHLQVNQIDFKISDGFTLRDIVEDQMCRSIPHSLCFDPTQKRYARVLPIAVPSVQVASRLGKGDLERTIALIHLAKTLDNPFCSQNLAEERALRAQSCRYVRRARVCYSCHHAGPVRQCMGDRRSTSLDNKLYVCGKLGVYMQAAVHINLAVYLNLFSPADILNLDKSFWLYPELTAG